MQTTLRVDGEMDPNIVLPDGLLIFSCQRNNLTELPKLPEGLIELNCSDNPLAKLPELPNSLLRLYCDNNTLTELPKLPGGLLELGCTENPLTKLPDLPNSLVKLYCTQTNIRELPILPDGLTLISPQINNLDAPFDRYIEEYGQNGDIQKLIGRVNNHILKRRGRNLSALTSTVGRYMPENVEGLTGSYLTGVNTVRKQGKPTGNQLRELKNQLVSFYPEAPPPPPPADPLQRANSGGPIYGGRKLRKTRKSRKNKLRKSRSRR
jgi:hypothetical protein